MQLLLFTTAELIPIAGLKLVLKIFYLTVNRPFSASPWQRQLEKNELRSFFFYLKGAVQINILKMMVHSDTGAIETKQMSSLFAFHCLLTLTS